jgi:carbamoyl-phosphate synthase/aspartate carbamoyltransferase/dihydroorotase
LIDPHVHLREPGATYKEDWDSGTAAALAGGFTIVLAMPNTQPPITSAAALDESLEVSRHKARCDYAQFVGACPGNAVELAGLARRSAGLKMYLDQPDGPLHLDDMTAWTDFFANWPPRAPLAVGAGGRTLAAALLMADIFRRPLHVCQVSTREEILLIRRAKERGLAVTCEVAPHHLFLSEQDLPRFGVDLNQTHLLLGTPADRQALWDNLDVIDCFASDHAPHIPAEKNGGEALPGFPGLETSLALLLTAADEGRLTLDDIVLRACTNPRRIYHLPKQAVTWIEIDPQARWEIRAADLHSRSGWTPFEGMPVRGQVRRVVLRGREVFKDGLVLALPGYGRDVRGNVVSHQSSVRRESSVFSRQSSVRRESSVFSHQLSVRRGSSVFSRQLSVRRESSVFSRQSSVRRESSVFSHQLSVRRGSSVFSRQLSVRRESSVFSHQLSVRRESSVFSRQSSVRRESSVFSHQLSVRRGSSVFSHQSSVRRESSVFSHQLSVRRESSVFSHQLSVRRGSSVFSHQLSVRRESSVFSHQLSVRRESSVFSHQLSVKNQREITKLILLVLLN